MAKAKKKAARKPLKKAKSIQHTKPLTADFLKLKAF